MLYFLNEDHKGLIMVRFNNLKDLDQLANGLKSVFIRDYNHNSPIEDA